VITEVLVACLLLIWLPILLREINQRGFLILLIWLFVAPIASNVVNRPGSNPFLEISAVEEAGVKPEKSGQGYITRETTVRMRELLEPNRLIVGAYLVVFLLTAVRIKKLAVPLDRTEKWMAAFSLLLVASALLQSRRTAFGLRVASDAFIVPFLSYAVARRLVITEDRFRKISQVLGYMGFYVIVICFVERLVETDIMHRLSGPFDRRDALYIVMMVVFFAVLIEWIITGLRGQEGVIPYGVQICVLTLAPVAILFTWTRGPWLGFLLGIWTFAFLGRKLVMWRPKLLIIGLVLLVFPVTVLGVQELLGTEEVYSRVANIRNVYGRLATYRIMVNEMSNNPVFGIGLNNVRDLLAEEKESVYGMRSYAFSHNSYLALATELGAVGILVYLAMAVSLLRTGLRVFRMGKNAQDRWRGIAVTAIMVAYLIPPAFDSTLYQAWVSHIYVYVYAGGIAGVYGLEWLRRPVRANQGESGTAAYSSALTR
jgi:O-antigen ligase